LHSVGRIEGQTYSRFAANGALQPPKAKSQENLRDFCHGGTGTARCGSLDSQSMEFKRSSFWRTAAVAAREFEDDLLWSTTVRTLEDTRWIDSEACSRGMGTGAFRIGKNLAHTRSRCLLGANAFRVASHRFIANIVAAGWLSSDYSWVSRQSRTVPRANHLFSVTEDATRLHSRRADLPDGGKKSRLAFALPAHAEFNGTLRSQSGYATDAHEQLEKPHRLATTLHRP
jgi:hypothetical protein